MLLAPKFRVSLVLAALWLASAPRLALAQEALTDPLAREFKQAGDEAMKSLRYEDALSAYERATAIEPHPTLLFNRARALQALQRYPEALEHFEAFRAEASPELFAKAGKLDELIERLRQQVSSLQILCNVRGATVLIRGQAAGVTPLEGSRRVNAGAATVDVYAEGYLPYQTKLVLEGARETTLEVRLVARQNQGRLRVRAGIAGSLVYVDGVRLGSAPAETSLARGRHRVRVEHPDYRSAETTVELRSGESRTIDVALEKRPGLTSKWWFWTGAAALAVAGAGVAVALLTERSPSRGDIAPGVVSGPLLKF